MKISVLLAMAMIFMSVTALARDGGDRLKIGGFYGLGQVNPSDANAIQSTLMPSTPKIGNISTSTIYGGHLGLMLGQRWELEGAYEMQDAKNPTNTTAPAVNNAGLELMQNEVWLGLNYYLVHSNNFFFYLGAFGGYPTYSHIKQTYTVNAELDADKAINYMGKAGVGVMLGNHFSLFFEGGYQSMVSGDVKNSAGQIQTLNGHNSTIDLSGGRADAGLNIVF
jgi:hypothetical protein